MRYKLPILDDDEEWLGLNKDLDDSYLNVPRRTTSRTGPWQDEAGLGHSSSWQSTFQMSSKLRESCKAHDIQLVVEDGLKVLDVSGI
ncbi:Uncharacterized protein APZ42_010241 [Daphnia magna]|uniref:Uncharacterized protein n=1 Tax=Daphnia magna TaxID=35525 RepID=A0A164DHL9_9CRUS|nr:Uncharacterized protein APZ42_010241 [Daphnia magna]